jgi:hypothetical protein
MTIEEARALLERYTRQEQFKYDAFGYEEITARYEAGTPAQRQEILDMFLTLLLDGERHEPSWAATFLANRAANPAVLHPIVTAYTQRSGADLGPLQQVLGYFVAQPDAADRAVLADLFVRDPKTHFGLAPMLLGFQPTGPVWDAFARVVPTLTDVPSLRLAADAAYVAHRSDDFYAMLGGRPPAFLKSLALQLPSDVGAELLRYHKIP